MKTKLLVSILAFLFIRTSLFGQYEKILDFEGATNGSNAYYGSLVSDGTFLYGMTEYGGINNKGVIFKIMPNGSGYVKLLDFDGILKGGYPAGSLIYINNFLYGMAANGGINNKGVIFKIKPDGSGYLNLLEFAGTSNGSNPYGALISDGTFLYGMTTTGGTNGDGTIFKIMPDGSNFLKLFDFTVSTSGRYPYGSLISDGTFLYGMTELGGAYGAGTIIKIMSDGSGYVKLLDFNATASGSNPWGSLISVGTFLYGMTENGGTKGDGTIFKIMPDGTGYVKLLDFDGPLTGRSPDGSLIYDGTFLYGMTENGGTADDGVIFKIKPDGSNYLKLLDFDGAAKGSDPLGSLFSDGNFFYGMTEYGGINNKGVVFKYGLVTGIDQLSVPQPAFSIYPNPAKGELTVSFSEELKNAKAEIYNIFGVKVIEENISNTYQRVINLKNISPGIYFVNVYDGNRHYTKKLIIEQE